MSELTFELDCNTEDFQKLVALCLEQTKLINELHEQVYDSAVLDNKVVCMFDNIREMRLDEYLSEIRYEAFLAGVDWSNVDFDQSYAQEAFGKWNPSL
jgi:hypothetical protein